MSKKEQKMDIVGIVTIGFFLMLLGLFQLMIYIKTANYQDSINVLFQDFHLTQISPNFYIPAPQSDHPVLYNTIFQFSLIFGVFEIFALAARFILKDPVDKKAGTISGIIFWLGTALLTNQLLTYQIGWNTFFGYIITLLGLSIIINVLIVFISNLINKN